MLTDVSLALRHFSTVFVKDGANGIALFHTRDFKQASCKVIKPNRIVREPVSVNGAGDSFAGAILTLLCRESKSLDMQTLEKIVRKGMQASEMSLECELPVNPKLDEITL